MNGDLQAVVDDLAERLSRSVVIDDPVIRLLCTSRHFGDEDPVRVRSVLQRTADKEIISFVLGQHPDRWPGAGMLAGSAELGLLPRLCVPVREQDELLGYLMVIDADRTLTADEIDAAERCARTVGAQLYAEQASEDGHRAAADAAMRDLLGDVPDVRRAARDRLLRDGVLRETALALVTVVEIESLTDAPVHVEMAYRTALRGVPASIPSRAAVDRDRAILLQLRSRPAAGEELRAQALRMREAVAPLLHPAAGVRVGVGGHAAGLAAAWRSRREAEVALRAAGRSAGLDGVGLFEELGEVAVLAQLPDDVLGDRIAIGALRALAEHPGGTRLRETLRCFLDHAGSVPRTAAALHLHRTSLHYRLARIREVTGLDIDDGRHRLVLHLALRLDDLGFPTE